MNKKIYIKENSIKNVLNKRLLPQFLFKMVKTHDTSLGDNSMFPSGGEYPFDYTLLKTRYNEVCDAIEELGLESLEEDYLMSELSALIKMCKDMEAPIRDTLEKICENAINRLFAIPTDILNLKLKLVDKVKFKNSVRLRPEGDEEIEYTFADVDDIEFSNKAVEKRRFINSLIQGAAYTYSNILGLYIEDIDKVNRELIPLYRKIIIINDYLLFTKKEEMTDDNPMQGSYVEVHLGMADNKTTISAQGIIFPLLLQETIKGIFELFSAHGLPEDIEKARYVIKKADFVLAEPWDLRLGVGLWNKIFGKVEDTNMIPYMFTNLIKEPTEEFIINVKEILSSTRKGNEIINTLIQQAEYDNGYQQFTNRINAKNIDRSLIKDSYFNGAEENGLELDSDSDDGDVIEEDDIEENGSYQSFDLKNNGIETWYRGICGSFNKDLNKRQIWLAETPEYAAQYAEECEDGHLYAFDVDMSKFNEYDWWEENDYFEPIDGFSEEEQMELMKQGYNGYTFALDEGTVLVLFDSSLIVDVKEIPIYNDVMESKNKINEQEDSEILGQYEGEITKPLEYYQELVKSATNENIDFLEGNVHDATEDLIITINNEILPRQLALLMVQPIKVRISENERREFLQVHIILDKGIQRLGLAPKIYKKLILTFGPIYSGEGRRVNKEHIAKVYEKLAQDPMLYVYHDEMCYIAMKKA